MKTINERVTTIAEPGMVVLIIGMRINKWWKFRKWLFVLMSMGKMVMELYKKPESGFLGEESRLIGRKPMLVQYWKSYEEMLAFANDRKGLHYPAWAKFNQLIGSSGDVGIWHETYVVDRAESIYHNIPPIGLGKFVERVPVKGKLEHSAGRLKQSAEMA